jgi:hypothetical protein
MPTSFGGRRSRAFAALVSLAAFADACKDAAGPGSLGTTLPARMYVLQGPIGDAVSSTIQAETLYVESGLTYRLAGVYWERHVGARYEESGPFTAVRQSDGSLILPSIASGTRDVRAEVRKGSLVIQVHTLSGLTPAVYLAADPPPPSGPVASLVLTTSDTAIRHRETLDIGELVVRGVDATGRWVRRPEVTVVAPEGWPAAVDGVITAPSFDATGEVELRADGSVTRLRIAAVPDLRNMHWRLSYSCDQPFDEDFRSIIGDSAAMDLVVDSARYAPPGPFNYQGFPFLDQGYYMKPWAAAAAYAQGTLTRWYREQPEVTEVSLPVAVIVQRADSIVLNPPHASLVTLDPLPMPLYRAPGEGRLYIGESSADPAPSMCIGYGFNRSGPARLEQVP